MHFQNRNQKTENRGGKLKTETVQIFLLPDIQLVQIPNTNKCRELPPPLLSTLTCKQFWVLSSSLSLF